ncbi:MAG: [FeFe] hydrogenase H-cluster radical SAM maturase HydE [Bacteroidales bacterium]|nr:[FeFe] hydrogenase H-cluster radical SAM maturase HydE [Bacteroidales bacterium]
MNKNEIIQLLQSEGEDKKALFQRSMKVKEEVLGNFVYFRGLIEFSNACAKNCLYCGIRKDNKVVERYNLTDKEIVEAAEFSLEHGYGSIVLQSGEIISDSFTKRITKLLDAIHKATQNKLRVTLSVGEQSRETYKQWYEHGAHRYLLRIESSNPELYCKIHPNDSVHDYQQRLQSLNDLRDVGFQVGTGVMIGLPFQTMDDLASDLLFIKDFGIDMVGMGPYIEHADTPLIQHKEKLMPLEERFQLTLKMISVLRVLMPEINIAAATALQAIDKAGREKAIKIGANVMMPNVTPGQFRDDYKLYENKPCTDENADDCANCLEARVALAGNEIAYNKWGDSLHYRKRVG